MAQFTNQARLSYRNTVVDSNVAVGEITGALEIGKTAVREEYTGGETLTFAVSVVNNGTGEISGITLTDDLGAYEYQGETLYPLQYVEGSVTAFLNGAPQTAPAPQTESPLVFTGITLPAGADYMLIYQAALTRFAPLDQGSTVVNSVTASEASDPVTAQVTVTVESAPDLTILKSIEPVPVAENGQITYTLTVQNYGNTATSPEDDVTVTDLFDPILTDLTVTFNGTPWTQGTEYTYNAVTGAFATAAGEVTVPAAVYSRDADTGAVVTMPGTATLVITGTV